MTHSKDQKEGDQRERNETNSEADLIDDSASEQFFGPPIKKISSRDITIDGPKQGGDSPLDSPSVQFFGETLEEFVEAASEDSASTQDRTKPDRSASLDDTSGE